MQVDWSLAQVGLFLVQVCFLVGDLRHQKAWNGDLRRRLALKFYTCSKIAPTCTKTSLTCTGNRCTWSKGVGVDPHSFRGVFAF